jgi:hypothetical protein
MQTTPEIQIVLKQLGDRSQASCAIPLPGGRVETHAAFGRSGKRAVEALLEGLAAKRVGEPWVVAGTPLRGVVPPRPRRKPAKGGGHV